MHFVRYQIRAAIKKMKQGKATVELLEALEDYGTNKITRLLDEIYDSGQILPDISKSVFIALLKKPGKKQCHCIE